MAGLPPRGDYSSRTSITAYFMQPTRKIKRETRRGFPLFFLYGFAPDGVYPASSIAR